MEQQVQTVPVYRTVPRPKSFNDDDFYVVDLSQRIVIRHVGCKMPEANEMRAWGYKAPAGQAVLTGMALRHRPELLREEVPA